MSVGLLGATGILDVDGLTIDLVPVGGGRTTNLVVNGDFELGDPDAGRLDRRQRGAAGLPRATVDLGRSS